MLDIDNSFILFQNSKDGTLYKAPIRALEGVFALANGESEGAADVLASIDQLSSTILMMSTLISADYYCREEVEKKFEMLSSTNMIPIDPTILEEKQISKYPLKHNLVKYEDAQGQMMSVEGEIDKYFSNIDKESNAYF